MSLYALFTNKAYILVLIYTCFVIYQLYYIKYYIVNWHSLVVGDKTLHMQHNIKNKGELNRHFQEVIGNRIKKLEEMSYGEWLDYNNKNPEIYNGDYTYNISVYERVKNDNANYNIPDRFLLRANKYRESLGLTFEELLKMANYTFLFSIFSPHPDLLHTIFQSTHYKNGTNIYSFYGVDSDLNRPVKMNAIGGKFSKDEGDEVFEGVIYAGYSLLDVEEQYANKYYDFLSKKFLIATSLGTIVTALLMYYASGRSRIWLPFAFLLASNYYILSFIDVVEGITDMANEENKVKDINEGILSISFLAAVNVFIIQSLQANPQTKGDYYEPALLFMLGLVMLLSSLYKITNYNRIDEIRVHRIEKQFMYNGSIYLNMFILVFYSLFILRESKVPMIAYKKFYESITAK